MTYLRRLAALLPFSVLFIAPGISGAQQHAPIAEQIGKAYGLNSFGQVEAIRYTLNIPALKLSRTWVWEPKTDTVTYVGPDKEGKPVKVTYKREALSSQSDAVKNDIDPAFVNDHYVLLFPLHVAWDDSATVTDEGIQEMQTGRGEVPRAGRLLARRHLGALRWQKQARRGVRLPPCRKGASQSLYRNVGGL